MAQPYSLDQYRYDPGEDRHKHHGRKPFPYFREEGSVTVGMCPSTISHEVAERLLHTGVADFDPDQPSTPPARVYAVHEGVVYEARPTLPGSLSYHGFPWRGRPRHNRLPRAVKRVLRERAEHSGFLSVFKEWLRDHEC